MSNVSTSFSPITVRIGALFLFASLFLSACTPPPKEWTREDIVGLSIDLIDSVNIQQMVFGKDGSVSYSFGTKGGGMVYPLFYWRLVNGRLQVFDTDKTIQEELTLLSRDASTIVVRRKSGKVAKYRIHEKRAA